MMSQIDLDTEVIILQALPADEDMIVELPMPDRSPRIEVPRTINPRRWPYNTRDLQRQFCWRRP